GSALCAPLGRRHARCQICVRDADPGTQPCDVLAQATRLSVVRTDAVLAPRELIASLSDIAIERTDRALQLCDLRVASSFEALRAQLLEGDCARVIRGAQAFQRNGAGAARVAIRSESFVPPPQQVDLHVERRPD